MVQFALLFSFDRFFVSFYSTLFLCCGSKDQLFLLFLPSLQALLFLSSLDFFIFGF